MPYQSAPSFLRRWLAGLLALMIGLGPLASPAYAALTPLADQPINIKNQAKPNIVLTVDDSSSMLYDFLPDYVVGKITTVAVKDGAGNPVLDASGNPTYNTVLSDTYCRDRTGAMNALCGFSGSPTKVGTQQSVSPQYIWEQPLYPFPQYGTGAGQMPVPNPGGLGPLFSNSGPGAGCNLTPPNPPSCSGGIDPGALPGISIYPATSGSPLAGQPYEYWLLWPAPAHNSALNHMYYNPRLTYDPPAYADATSFPQMDSTHTSGWTKVRTNPFTTPVTPADCTVGEPCADLTANVIVGQWCNSDWTQGNDDSGNPYVSNAAYCRTNGVVASASNGSPAAIGDYMYPWTPTSITPDDYTSKVDMSTISTVAPVTNATVKAAWAGAQDTKYFYENDNVLWCDITNPEWPDTTSNPLIQSCDMSGPAPTCNGYRGTGTCSATATGTCTGYAAGTCNTGNGNCAGFTAGACNTGNGTCAGVVAGACNTANGNCNSTAGTCNLANGNCNSTLGTCNTGNGVCAGVTAGTCNVTNGVCNGTTGACNTASGNCNGFVTGACGTGQVGNCGAATSCTATREACVAGTAASCGGMSSQTCNGATQKTCNDVGQTCNGALGAQTCINIVAIPPDPSTCTSAWNPPGCNLNPDPEGTCIYQTTCPPPTFAGNCSKQTSKVCTADGDCPFIYGTCSTQTTKQCTTNSDCTGLKYCQGTTTVCAANSDCGFVAGSGTCSKDGKPCTDSFGCAANAGSCNYQTTGGVANGICYANTDCSPFPNHCATTTGTIGCAIGPNSFSCPLVPNSGTCQYSSTSGGSCSTTADCTNKCQNALKLGLACASNATCTVTGTCSAGLPNTTSCTQATDCNKNGSCTTGVNTGAACTANGANATCGGINKCSAGLPNTTTCTTAAQCNVAGTCQTGINTGSACTGSGVQAACGPIDKCSAGLPNTTSCTTNANCNTTGTCTSGANTGATCTVNGVNAACGAVNKCTVGKTGITCTTNAQCNTDGTCTTGTNTGTACTVPGVNAACGPIDKCTVGKVGNACTANANCNTDGTCTTGTNTGAACTVPGVNAACGAVDRCSAGKPATTVCTTAAQCNVTGACTSGANTGAACTTNGVQAACGVVNKCTAGKDPSTTCTTNAACTVNGACTTGSNTGASCAANGVNATCGVVNKCTAGAIGNACTADATCTVNGSCTSGNVGINCTANGATAQCALPNGFCSNYAGNTRPCTVGDPTNQCAGSTGQCSNNSAQACTTDASPCTPFGKCSLTGSVCTAAGATNPASPYYCPNQPGPKQPVNATCDDKTAISGITLLADANGSGKACRRNNHAYPDGTTASQINYPSGKYTSPVVGAVVAGQGCSATARYASVPRHYWKTEVEWCDKAVSTAGDKWLGYGDIGSGTCQDFKDTAHIYPRFYQFGAAIGTDNYGTAAFARTDLVPTATYTHQWTDDSGTAQTVVRSYADEMTNYANWFAYYRTRLQAVKTVTSLAFLAKTGNTLNLDDSFRVGFHTMFSYQTSFVNIADFDSTQKATWATQLMGVTIPLGQETPTLNTIARIGQYYANGSNPLLPGSTDPIVLSCQKNWHMFFTDGFTNQNAVPTSVVGDVDGTIPIANTPLDAQSPPVHQLPVNGNQPAAITGLLPGQPWPPPFAEDPNGQASNSASDYVMNYWVTDLRPSMPMNVATSLRDPASWPHQNFAAMSLGTEGILPSGNQSVVEGQLTSGALQWPKPQPTVYKPDESGVDDLWHAAINGRGRFVNAQSADELKLGMGQILQDVVNQEGARAGAGFQGSTISGTNNFIYRTTFEPGWGASLSKVRIDPATGDPDTACPAATCWEASTQLALQLTVTGANPTPWFTSRNVVTVDETGKAVPFLAGQIGPNQLDSLAPGKTPRAQAIVEFLRGNRNNEGTKVGQFRVRIGGLLGDIVDSQPVYVGKPNAPYLEANDPGYTLNFKNDAAFAGRPVRVYVGANDGMLHAFDDSNGNEAWAFVPSDLFRADETGLGALSYQDGALPPFVHHYYVDATPRVSDVNFGGGTSDWHSMLVGGLGKGGKAYYALDISQPADITSETESAKRVLWRFSNDDLGYTYGRAIIAKTHAFSEQWVVIVPSGYNNVPDTAHPTATGKGKIFILSAKDGSLLKTLTTNSGTTTSPSGLAQIAAYEKDYRNQFAEQIYGGDLDGNFWRFDISAADDTAWPAVVKMATFTDKLNGNAQAVTTPPQIEIDISNGVDRWVFVGTGRLLDDTDLTTPAIADQIQTMYAIRDGTASAPITPWPATLAPHTDMSEVTDKDGLAAKPDKGWYDDLPSGQRIVVPVQAALSLIAYIGTSPQTDPCLTGQPATVYAREYGRGNSLLQDENGNPVESLYEQEGGVSIQLVALDGGSSDSAAGGFPDLRIAITAGTTGKVTFVKPVNPDFAQKHRMSWRLLGQ